MKRGDERLGPSHPTQGAHAPGAGNRGAGAPGGTVT